MILRNYYKILAAMICSNSTATSTNLGTITVKNPIGEDCALKAYTPALSINFGRNPQDGAPLISVLVTGTISQNSTVYGVAFGDGDTPPSFDDYGLSGNHIKTLQATTSQNYIFENEKCSITETFNLINTSENTLTIKEVALFARPYRNASNIGGGASSYSVCVERTVLDEPVVIPGGGFGVVKYTITFTIPS